jgi:aspartyl-tRNA(Asn)/glutamyl-tRNA(Gln) amidotransferase subunit C
MPLSRAQVEHVAELAKLRLSEEEIDQYTGQLSAILDYAQELTKIDTESIPPTASVLPLRSIMADDICHDNTLDHKTLLDNAPDAEAGQFRVQAIFD